MDEQEVRFWIKDTFSKRPGGLLRKRSMIALDSFEGHRTTTIKIDLSEINARLVMIPGGCTGERQAMDQSCNKVFKRSFRSKYDAWLESLHDKNGHLKVPLRQQISWWVVEAWEEIPADIIRGSLRKVGFVPKTRDAEDSELEDSQQVIKMDDDLLFQVLQEFLFRDYNDLRTDLEQLSEIKAFSKIAEEFELFNVEEEEEKEEEVRTNEGAYMGEEDR